MAVPFAYAPYACRPEASRGRLLAEPESTTRSVFQRDRDRVVHSAAFRRLKQKTQVFISHEGDHYRTRLTHSLEVGQIARSICRVLGLDEDLAEALALAHDLGHTPFGHAGEEALDAAMAPFGGFDHNAQTLRILTRLERRYAEFDGLNLTWEALEGVVKHNGPLVDGSGACLSGGTLPAAIAEYVAGHDLELHTYPSAEAQVAALSDDIAYNSHDVEDGLRAGLFGLDDLAEVPLVGPIIAEVTAKYPGLEQPRLIHEVIRRLIDHMVNDLVGEGGRRLGEITSVGAQAVRELGRPAVGFSRAMADNDRYLKSFLYANMYNHYKLARAHSRARRVVDNLFNLFLAEPECLPTEWRRSATGAGTPQTARLVADFIAGMTDRFALDQHRQLFDTGSRP